jgi:capsular exopolysaccharide synthesis family protein
VARRRGWIALLLALLIPAGVYVFSARQPTAYQATLIVEVEDPGYAAPVIGDLSPSLNPGAVLVADSSLPSVTGATAKLGPRPVGTVEALSASLDTRTGWVTLQATAPTPPLAIAGANAFLRALTDYVQRDASQRLDAAIASTRRSLAGADRPAERRQAADTLATLVPLREASGGSIRVVQGAQAQASSPNPGRNALLALALALLITPLIALLLDRLDRRVRRARELERLCGAPLLATIPGHAFDAADGRLGTDRAFQRLRDSLIFLTGKRQSDAIAVVSPLDGQGKTTVATRLARSFAQSGRRVLLIDANLSRPGVAARLGVPATPGLSELVSGQAAHPVRYPIAGLVGELSVLPAGSPPPNPFEILGSQRFSTLIERLATEYEVVVIDTASLLAAGDTLALLHQVSGVVAVARLHRTPRAAVRRMAQIVTSADGRLLGIVATGATAQPDAATAYAYDDSDADSRPRAAQAH